MIRSLYFPKEKQIRVDLPLQDYTAALQDPDGLLWVDFQETPPAEDEPILREIFHFHPLAIDDALAESHVPKVDDWESYLYVVLHSISFNENDNDLIKTHELDVFLGKNFVVTHHDQKLEAIDRVWTALQRDVRFLTHGADHLMYRLTDEVVASYMPVVDALDEAIDRAEDEVFDRPTSRTLEQIFRLKRGTLHLRRIVGPQREVLNRLARDDYEVIDSGDRIYFRDVYDHLVRLYDITDSLRDLVGGSLDTYLSVINNRMNEIMKTLTIITTIFMPISFIASYFGMNFFQPVSPALAQLTNIYWFIGTMIFIVGLPVGMYFYMRKRGWMTS